MDLGYFPSGPSTPGYGFCLNLLNLLLEITRTAPASLDGLTSALHRHHRMLGHVLRSSSVRFALRVQHFCS